MINPLHGSYTQTRAASTPRRDNSVGFSSEPVEAVASPSSVSLTPTQILLSAGEKRLALSNDGEAVSVGRHNDNAFTLESELVSRRHAEVRSLNGSLQVKDLGSTNGTYIGKTRLEPNRWYLTNSEKSLKFGDVAASWTEEALPTADTHDDYSLLDSQGVRQDVQIGKDGFFIGRQEGSDLKLDGGQISRRHARLVHSNNGLAVEDLGSSNGTFLENKKLEPGKLYPVRPGQTLDFAGAQFKLTQTATAAVNTAAAAIGGPAGLAVSLAGLKEFASKNTLEEKGTLLQSIRSARSEMLKDSGIVDLPKGVPTMVIPDIHAQRQYITRALEHKVDGKPVFDLLQEGKMNLLLLGDGMHGEGRARSRWEQAEQDLLAGKPSSAMRDEMVESMGTMKMVMDLKSNLGDNFVYLRGNHDDINPEHGYRKYTGVGESTLVKHWTKENYGEDFLKEWHSFEQSMPLIARGEGFVASHAAPGEALDAKSVENRSESAFRALAWTENRHWQENGTERQMFENNLRVVGGDSDDKWLVGHRKVEDADYRSQFDGKLVQINPLDSDGFVVAMIGADGSYDPAKDTFRV